MVHTVMLCCTYMINPRARGYCSRSVCRSVGLCLCSHVFSRTVAAVDTKRGYVGVCNGRSAQQESGAALSKNSMFMGTLTSHVLASYV